MSDYIANINEYLPLSPLAINIGVTCLILQILFTILFNRRTNLLPQGPWTYLTMFSAHQVIALPLMIILTCVGFRDWYTNPPYETTTATHRIFAMSNPNDIPLAIGSGAILLWDIPTGFMSPPLRDPVMWVHHVGMFMVSATMSGLFCKWGNMIGYYYAPYFFGVIELSSIFLAYVDIFHPKYKYYYKWLNGQHTDMKSIKLQSVLCNINEVARILFAVSFLAFRGIYFPYVVFNNAIPDLKEAYNTPPDGVPMWTGYFLAGAMAVFALLQAYWAMLISRQIVKTLSGGDSDKKKKGKSIESATPNNKSKKELREESRAKAKAWHDQRIEARDNKEKAG